jgi:hypothetical protein
MDNVDIALEVMAADTAARELALELVEKVRKELGRWLRGGIIYAVEVRPSFKGYLIEIRLSYKEHNLGILVHPEELERNTDGYLRYIIERAVFDLSKSIFLKDDNP